jgi:hypothetical protein
MTEGDSCPRCGAPHGPDQEYCLECGLRLGGRRGLAGTVEAWWRDRFGSYPGDWVLPALLGFLIAVAGATVAIVVGAGSGGDGSPIVATKGGSPHAPTAPTPTETVALPTVPSGTPTATTPPPTSPPPATTSPTPPGAPGSLVAWPAGRSGFTVVLESIPTSAGRSFALARARSAARSGLPSVGILDSGRFSSLHPGYFVVFSGVYRTRSEADQARITGAAKGYPNAYAREIRR